VKKTGALLGFFVLFISVKDSLQAFGASSCTIDRDQTTKLAADYIFTGFMLRKKLNIY
jgi:hypothetical protein